MMDKYFSAKEAREISNSIETEKMHEELDYIYSLINTAIYEGRTSITIENKIFLDSSIMFLKNKGFETKLFTGSQLDPVNNTIISW